LEGGRNYFDVVSIHPYSKDELNWQGIHDTYKVMKHFGDGAKKIWMNEYGWDTKDEGNIDVFETP